MLTPHPLVAPKPSARGSTINYFMLVMTSVSDLVAKWLLTKS